MVPSDSATIAPQRPAEFEGLAIVDCDVHPYAPWHVASYLPARWRTYLEKYGNRGIPPVHSLLPGVRAFASRLDTMPPCGRPGADPDFTRGQLLDAYGIDVAILTEVQLFAGNRPAEFERELARATNDVLHEIWLESDPRWLASIKVAADQPETAAAEIARARELSDRFVQVMPEAQHDRPLGHPRFWPIFEAAADLDLPVAIHASVSKQRPASALGEPGTYYELRTGSADLYGQPLAASLIFEGVLDRFPDLKVVFIELDWTWVVPLAWRMDQAYRQLRDEVGHLELKPSEYLRRNFWFSTQPALEPEHPEQFHEMWAQWERAGLADRLMFATDYPHWDMDSPFETIPLTLPRELKRKILSENAEALYGIDVGAKARQP
jgi:predicted TIM-barrel fold metal-dependent hydrolase